MTRFRRARRRQASKSRRRKTTRKAIPARSRVPARRARDTNESDPRNIRERAAEIRQSYLDYPSETPDVDYKAAVLLRAGDDFALDLVRHILGMANAGGGHLVIGFREDASKTLGPDPSMDDAIARSYDPSSLADHVEKYIRGTDKISLRVHRHQHLGKVFPIIDVDGFERRPFFCRSTKKNTKGKEVLKEGVLYFRSASARTLEIASPEEWDRLITLCVQRQQDDLYVRFYDLMERAGFLRLLHSSGRP